MQERRARQLAGVADAFVETLDFPAIVARLEAAFEKAAAEQTAAATGR